MLTVQIRLHVMLVCCYLNSKPLVQQDFNVGASSHQLSSACIRQAKHTKLCKLNSCVTVLGLCFCSYCDTIACEVSIVHWHARFMVCCLIQARADVTVNCNIQCFNTYMLAYLRQCTFTPELPVCWQVMLDIGVALPVNQDLICFDCHSHIHLHQGSAPDENP